MKNRYRTLLIVLFLSNGFFFGAFGQSYQEAIRDGRILVKDIMAEYKIPGMSVAVGVHGKIVWSEGFGFADIENQVPVSPLTRFRIASISKPVSAAAVGLLYERGKLDLDAPVQRYVPYFPKKEWEITPREIAGHIAGIRHYKGNEFSNTKHYNSVREAIGIFKDDPLQYEPRTKYLYSSYDWNLMSAVVEGASGQEFLKYMQQAVFNRLNMRSIIAEHVDSLISHRAKFYVLNHRGKVQNAPYVDNSNKWAGGGFLSNAEDLVTFGSAHLEGNFLKPETVSMLFKSQKLKNGHITGYGIGWASGIDPADRNWVGHSGGAMGGRTMLVVYPESGIVIAILANIGSAPMNGYVAQSLADAFFPEGKTFASNPDRPLDPSLISSYVGTYKGDGKVIQITFNGRHLVGRLDGGESIVLHAASNSSFYLYEKPDKVRFHLSADLITGLTLNSNNQEIRFMKQ